MTLGIVTNACISLCLVFASVSLLVSTVTEGLASALKLRSATLVDGLKSMLNARTPVSVLRPLLPPLRVKLPAAAAGSMSGPGLLQDLLKHAAINPLGPSDTAPAGTGQVPSYISPAGFAAALIDTVCPGQPNATFADVSNAINGITDPQIKQMLQGIVTRSDNDLQKLHDGVAKWFDASMDRVSGDYKRYVQLWSFLIGLAIAILFNIDAIGLAYALLTNPILGASVQVTASDAPTLSALTTMQAAGLPIGWTTTAQTLGEFLQSGLDEVHDNFSHSVIHLCGWLMVAAASLYGAPFWFDTLQRFVKLRGTGDKPDASAQP